MSEYRNSEFRRKVWSMKLRDLKNHMTYKIAWPTKKFIPHIFKNSLIKKNAIHPPQCENSCCTTDAPDDYQTDLWSQYPSSQSVLE